MRETPVEDYVYGWENKTQIIDLFAKKGQRGNTLVGLNIMDKQSANSVSFCPSYDQVSNLLAALDVFQCKPKKGDEKFWLNVVQNGLLALSKRDIWYDNMLGAITKKIHSGDLDRKHTFRK